MRRLIIGMTGATGALFGTRLLAALRGSDVEAHLVVSQWAERTIEHETGMSVAAWRQQLRLLTALMRLGAGASVTQVALEVGYSDVSSFIAVFKDALGETPARFFR